MLQQTQVDTVAPRYEEFLRRFPDVHALARATESEVCEAWAGLGYYRRARNLHAGACRVVDAFDGKLPHSAAELLRLPGIGRYTAGAIASIAFGEAAPIVDGNVERLLCRLYGIVDAPKSKDVQKRLWTLAAEWARSKKPGDVNQAMMELGATICRPRAPSCENCPLRGDCTAFSAGRQDVIPKKTAPPKRKVLKVAFAWCASTKGVLLKQRGLDGLWPGLWELPSAHGTHARGRLSAALQTALSDRAIVNITHQLSHRDVQAAVYRGGAMPQEDTTMRLFKDPLAAPLSALARKAIMAVNEAASREA